MQKTLLLKNANVLVTMDNARREIENGAVFVEDNQIQWVGDSSRFDEWLAENRPAAALYGVDTVINAAGCVVMPGLVNCHHHLYQTLTRTIGTGDGTTTATVLAQAIYAEGLKSVTAGVNPMALKRGIDAAVLEVVDHLAGMAVDTKGKKEIAQVASISANSDAVIGDLIADAMEKVGKDGVITVEEGKTLETEVEWVEGMQFDKGFLSPHFISDPATMECVLEDAYVLVFEKKISNIKDLVPLLEAIVQQGKPLLIVAEDVDAEALTLLVVNNCFNTSWSSCRINSTSRSVLAVASNMAR